MSVRRLQRPANLKQFWHLLALLGPTRESMHICPRVSSRPYLGDLAKTQSGGGILVRSRQGCQRWEYRAHIYQGKSS